jgi:hypothetical protein
MKKSKQKAGQLNLHRETLRALASASAAIGGAETGSNPHSACVTCSCVNCLAED